MNSQENRASFSPDQEKSHVKENSQNHRWRRAYDWGSGLHRRNPQQIRTAFARCCMLRIAAATMPRQPRLSPYKEVNHLKRVP